MKLPITLSYYDYFNLVSDMFLSNPYISLEIKGYGTVLCSNRQSSNISLQQQSEVTITSIKVRQPQFSIGDTVMIVGDTYHTGRTGYIYNIDNDMYEVDLGSIKQQYITSNLVKIPTDLINLLESE